MEENTQTKAEGNVITTVQYSGATAQAIITQIETSLGNLQTAYNGIMADWEVVKNKLTLEPKMMEILNNIGSIDSGENGEKSIAAGEFDKVVSSFKQLIENVKNINSSWAKVSFDINTALTNYQKKEDSSTSTTPTN